MHACAKPCCKEQLTVLFTDKAFLDLTGQLFSNRLKIKIMATASKGKITADRIKNDPSFERTRENMAEFTRAGKAGKLMRTVFRELLINSTDNALQGRLVKVFSRVIATDPVSDRGERTVSKGDLLQVKGFNFNQRAPLSDTLYVRCTVSINRTTGQVLVNIPAFVPRIMLQAVRGTTHFRIIAAAAALDFDQENYEYAQQATDDLPWDNATATATTLTLSLPANSTHPISVVLSVEFYQRVNARLYALKTGEFNPATVVKVDIPPVVPQL
jgi:hypothetical protein